MYRISKKFAWRTKVVHQDLSPNSARNIEIRFRYYWIIEAWKIDEWVKVSGLGSFDYSTAYNRMKDNIIMQYRQQQRGQIKQR